MIVRVDAVVGMERDVAGESERVMVLCDLIAGGLVVVEVMLAIEVGGGGDGAIEGEGGAQCGQEDNLLEDLAMTRVSKRRVGFGLGTEAVDDSCVTDI